MPMTHQEQEHRFRVKLEAWTPLRAAYHGFFTDTEISDLGGIQKGYDNSRRSTFLLSFENGFVSLGGLGTVMRHFPRRLLGAGERTVMLTPLHCNHEKVRRALDAEELRPVGPTVEVRCSGGTSLRMQCFQEVNAAVHTYHIGVDGFFSSREDPYHYDREEGLLEDVLAFSVAAPAAAAVLGYRDNLLFHANDWETALVGLTAKIASVEGRLGPTRALVTLHNSFDRGLSEWAARRFLGRAVPWRTVLQCAIPFLDAPLVTVSEPFAYELRRDPLQTAVFVPHLAEELKRHPVLGIENGLFGTPTPVFGDAALAVARRGRLGPLLQAKRRRERRLRERLALLHDSRVIGRFSEAPTSATVPLFVMSGRFDMAQKGFDVIFHAFRRLPRGTAQLLFSPSNPESGRPQAYRFFVDCAREREGEIVILPFRVPTAFYRDILRGGSYLLMPSMYEPFGAASEGALSGTPVVARATGGLWGQVRSWTPCPGGERYGGIVRAEGSEGATGILHREDFPDAEAGTQWAAILASDPWERPAIPLYGSMIDAAHQALTSAIHLYGRPREYARVILNGVDALASEGDGWGTAVRKYRRMYDIAAR